MVTWNAASAYVCRHCPLEAAAVRSSGLPGLEQSDGIVWYFPNRAERCCRWACTAVPVGAAQVRCKEFRLQAPLGEGTAAGEAQAFNMTYLDNLRPHKTGVIGRKLPPGDSRFVDTIKGRDN